MRLYILLGCIFLLGLLGHNKAINPESSDLYLEDEGSGDGDDDESGDEGSGDHYDVTKTPLPKPKGPYGATYDDVEDDDYDEYEEGSTFLPSVVGGDLEDESETEEDAEFFDADKDDLVPHQESDVVIVTGVTPGIHEGIPSPPMTASSIPPPTFKDSEGNGMDSTIRIINHLESDRHVSIFAQPGILGAFIGGAVVGLFLAIMLVMFIVYRMKKKDEGSYPLDEQKRMPLTASYSPNEKEIYA